MSQARVGALLALAAALLLGVLAAVYVPWDAVPGGRGPLPPPDAYFTADQLARAETFSRWARAWSWSSLAVSLAVATWLGLTQAGVRLVGRLRGPWALRVVQAVLAVLLAGRLAALPFAAALHELRLRYGLSTQGWAGWAADVARGSLVSVVVASVGVLVVVGLARRLPRAWPAAAGGVLAGLVVLGSFVYPLLVEPLFNDFESLPEGGLRAEVLALAEREGVAVDDVLVADASRRTTTLNAYVSGFGSSRRVVLYDTLVRGTPRGETLSVVAHELAHARRHDVVLGTALGAAGALGATGLGAVLLRRRPAGDPTIVPRLLALVAIGAALASPLENGVSRRIETRADIDALEATRDPRSFEELQVRLALRSLADPTPPAWSQIWFGSHPTILERLARVSSGQQAAPGSPEIAWEVWSQESWKSSSVAPPRARTAATHTPATAAARREYSTEEAPDSR